MTAPSARPSVGASLALALGAVLTLGASPASASTLWHVDPTHDVASYDATRAEYRPTTSSWPDITGVNAVYDASYLRIGTSITAYRRLAGEWFATARTSQGLTFTASWGFNDRLGSAEPLLRRSRTGSQHSSVVACEGFTITRTERGMTARIPTSCLGSPWRVRVGASAYTIGPSSGTRPGQRAIENHDNAFLDGLPADASPEGARRPDLGIGLSRWLTQDAPAATSRQSVR